jgi:ABC-type uncharacterized transport system involved in gliding motility auxiliary subunit
MTQRSTDRGAHASRRNLTLIGGGLALVLFFAINIATNAGCRAVRVDLTEDKVFTLDEGSKALTRNIDEPINLYFYFSRSLAREIPPVIEYAERVQGMLREYERASGGKIRLTVVDPEPFSEAEDLAVEQGIQGAPLPGGEVLYFGLVGTSSTDARESIPFFALDEDKQRTLEYDLSKLIWTLAHPDKKKVGILTALPLEGGGGNPMFGQQSEPRWQILDQIGDFFEIEVLPTSTEDLGDIDVLIVAHPRGFGDETLYLIDQWALAGKPLVVFVDPHCDVDPGASDDPTNPMSRFTAKKDSDLEKLFQAWGIELAKNKVACDRQRGVRQAVRSRDGRSQAELPVVFFLRLGQEDASRQDPVTRLLGNLLLVTPGSLKKRADGTTDFTPILQTSEESQEVDSAQFQFMPEPQALLASFVPGYERLTLAARVTGNVKSAFPDGKPGESKSEEPSTEDQESAESPAEAAAGLEESAKPLNLLVFADADMLHDRTWMRSLGNLGGTQLITLVSENVDLLKNAVESVSGGEELMSIRTRGKTSRPFERVQEIQREADQRFLARQQELERKLQDIDRSLTELQKAKGEGNEELVTAEQRKQVEKFLEEKVQTRRDLREVKHQLRKDIERLGTGLKWLNIALMPALVCAAAVALGTLRAQQRSRK